MDAQKSGYPDYLKTILERSAPGAAHRLLKPGGLIVADNILRRGLVADSTDANPWVEKEKGDRASYWTNSDVAKLDEFNTMMATNPRIEAFLMPLFDGVGLGRLLD
ncbi:MAG: hypothetical protein OK454_06675, partial [Thaumarchaeota archaeon]|nr:hypothetical protein [Nitrososphaerota archaeon]